MTCEAVRPVLLVGDTRLFLIPACFEQCRLECPRSEATSLRAEVLPVASQGPWVPAMEHVIHVPKAPSEGTAVVRAAELQAGARAAPHLELWNQKLWGGEQASVSFLNHCGGVCCAPWLRNSGLEAQKWVGLGVKKAEVVRAEGPGRKHHRLSLEPSWSGTGLPGTQPYGTAGPLQNQDATCL